MYESIQGVLNSKTPIAVAVQTGGIAYRISIPLSTYARLPALGEPILLFLSHVVREDLAALYGFLEKEERDLFETITTVSGIGPKTGLAIIGHIDIAAFQQAIAASDIRLLSKIPGIGKKTAERLVIEMRDKLKGMGKRGKGATIALTSEDSLLSDALNALLNLGYNPLEAQKAVQAALQDKKDETDLGRLITSALQKI